MRRALIFALLIGLFTSCQKSSVEEVEVGPFDGTYLVEYQEWNDKTRDGLDWLSYEYEYSFELSIENDRFSIDLEVENIPEPHSPEIILDGFCKGDFTWTSSEMTFGDYTDCDCFCACSPTIDCSGHMIFGTYNYEEETDQILLDFELSYDYELDTSTIVHTQRVELKLTLQE